MTLAQYISEDYDAVLVKGGSKLHNTEYGSINSPDHDESHAKISAHTGTLSFLGVTAIVVNSLTGPAMLNLPNTYQRSGLIPTTATIIFLCILSNYCSLHTANAISTIDGNKNFEKEIEYSQVFRMLWGQRAFIFTQLAFFCCIMCLLIASIVDTAQVIDQIFAHRQNGVSALRIVEGSVDIVSWKSDDCLQKEIENGECIPFFNEKEGSLIISLGYIVAALPFVPMSVMDLKENSMFQIIAFIILLVVSLQFIITFIIDGVNLSNVSLWGHDWGNLFGVVLFNFAAVLSVPAWLYEREKSVDVRQVISFSSFLGAILYILVGGLGALKMPKVTSNMLLFMMSGAYGPVTEICSEFFAFFIVGFGIPLFSVLMRLNLVGCGLCDEKVANIIAIYLPWLVSWMFYAGESTTILLGWGGIFFTSIVAFVMPLALALRTRMYSEYEGSVAISYGGRCYTKKAQIMALYSLLVISILSILFAIYGQLYDSGDD